MQAHTIRHIHLFSGVNSCINLLLASFMYITRRALKKRGGGQWEEHICKGLVMKHTSFDLGNDLSVSRVDSFNLTVTSNELVVDEKTSLN